MKIDGKCLCGLVSYEAEIDPAKISLCHCTDCQINSGSGFRIGTLVGKDDFRLLSGQLKTYIKTAQSGAKRALAFCPECGTHIYGTDAGNPQIYSLRVATSRQRGELIPSVQIWRRSAFGWLSGIDTPVKLDEQPPMQR
jgi:hypothetical protein